MPTMHSCVQRGLPAELRLYCHGQGYDLVERRWCWADETMAIEKDANFAVHPGYATNSIFAVISRQLPYRRPGPRRMLAPDAQADLRAQLTSSKPHVLTLGTFPRRHHGGAGASLQRASLSAHRPCRRRARCSDCAPDPGPWQRGQPGYQSGAACHAASSKSWPCSGSAPTRLIGLRSRAQHSLSNTPGPVAVEVAISRSG